MRRGCTCLLGVQPGERHRGGSTPWCQENLRQRLSCQAVSNALWGSGEGSAVLVGHIDMRAHCNPVNLQQSHRPAALAAPRWLRLIPEETWQPDGSFGVASKQFHAGREAWRLRRCRYTSVTLCP